MDCPVCNVKLQMADRQGVEINYCPDCRGVWIDRGGLDKIIDVSGSPTAESRLSEGDRHHERDRYQELGDRRRKSWK